MPGTSVDAETGRGLAEAADEYLVASPRLKRCVIEAARKGAKPSYIQKLIKYAWTYNYVAELIRKDRQQNPGDYKS